MLVTFQLQRIVMHFKKVPPRSCRGEPSVSDTKALNSVPASRWTLLSLHYIKTDCRQWINKMICLKSLKTSSRNCQNVWFSDSH